MAFTDVGSAPDTVPTSAGPLVVSLDARTRGRLGPIGIFALVLLGLIVSGAIFAPLLAPHNPLAVNLSLTYHHPTIGWFKLGPYPFGTDDLGRDVLSRVLYGARTPLIIAGSAVFIGGVIGTMAGITAGFIGGISEHVLGRLADMQLAVPSILLALLVLAFGGSGIMNLILVISLTGWPSYFRICRSTVLSMRRRAFIESAAISGGSRWYIISRHLIRAVAPYSIVAATLDLSRAVLIEAGLSFLGLGVQPPTPDWGLMVSEGQPVILQAWWIAVFPGAALVLLVLASNILGDRLSDALAPGRARDL